MKKLCLVLLIVLCGTVSLKAQTEATFYTNHGNFVVLLYDSIMPITTTNFKDLVTVEFYDETIFHRVISNFVIQGGDPTGTGSGGPGYTIMDEFDSTTSNLIYTIAMANTGAPNSGGSQFFVNLTNNSFLDFDNAPLSSAHPVFGEVVSGTEAVDSIEVTPTDGSDRPITDVEIDSIRLTNLMTSGIDGVISTGSDGVQISIYPNPVSSSSSVSIALAYGQQASLSVYDLTGRLLYESRERLSPGLNVFRLDSFGLVEGELDNGDGLYQLVVQLEGGRRFSQPFILVK